MKIELDLDQILGDPEFLRNEIAERVASEMRDALKKKIHEQTSMAIQEAIRTSVETEIPKLMGDILDTEFTPVTSWGEKRKPTTVRKEITRLVSQDVTGEGKYGEKSKIKIVVQETVNQALAAFRKEFSDQVNDQYRKEAMAYAVNTLKAKLGV